MGRRSYYDTDEERLPEGVRRVGYDADTQSYSYRDSRGRGYTSAPGVQYGRLFRTRAETVPAAPTSTNPFRTPSQTSKASDEPPKYLKERYVYLAPAEKEPEQRSPPTTFSQIFENAEEDAAALPPQHNKDIEEKPSRARSMRYRQRREAGNDSTQQPIKRRTTVKKLFQAVHRSMTVSKSSNPRRLQPELHRDAMHRQNTI